MKDEIVHMSEPNPEQRILRNLNSDDMQFIANHFLDILNPTITYVRKEEIIIMLNDLYIIQKR